MVGAISYATSRFFHLSQIISMEKSYTGKSRVYPSSSKIYTHTLLLLNSVSHFDQAKGFAPGWVLSCLFNLLVFLNYFSLFEQANGFSPVWVLLFFFNVILLLNALSPFEQANGFSPVWVL